MGAGRLDVAERALKARLRLEPANVAAMRMLAEVRRALVATATARRCSHAR